VIECAVRMQGAGSLVGWCAVCWPDVGYGVALVPSGWDGTVSLAVSGRHVRGV
jgi:hypothetical protein